MSNFSALLLDLDGTLLDTAPDMGAALNRLRVEHGRPALPQERIRPNVSHGAARLVKLGVPEADTQEFERLRGRFLELYSQNLAEHTRLFPDLDALLAGLERRGMPWGIVTNKPGWLTDPLLASIGLDHRASCVVSGDTLAERKPHPLPLLHAATLIGVEPARCVYVGDAERDIRAGRAAGMFTVVAAYGYISDEDDPASWQAGGIASEPAEIGTWLQAWPATAVGVRA
ncbi:MAG TPA: phosphoglycolate phosphatase [Steroidobacteraceae bacterium]|nr:phosphoglycolate phosphatase [Steroidobacteraceae bacterium]